MPSNFGTLSPPDIWRKRMLVTFKVLRTGQLLPICRRRTPSPTIISITQIHCNGWLEFTFKPVQIVCSKLLPICHCRTPSLTIISIIQIHTSTSAKWQSNGWWSLSHLCKLSAATCCQFRESTDADASHVPGQRHFRLTVRVSFAHLGNFQHRKIHSPCYRKQEARTKYSLVMRTFVHLCF